MCTPSGVPEDKQSLSWKNLNDRRTKPLIVYGDKQSIFLINWLVAKKCSIRNVETMPAEEVSRTQMTWEARNVKSKLATENERYIA